ncbi:MAG: phage tail tape measure protein [Selenomonadaceae bacterium]
MSKIFQIQMEIAGRMGAGLVSAFSSTTAQMQRLGAQSAALRGNLRTLDTAYSSGVMSVNSYREAQARLKAQLEQTQGAQARLKAAQVRSDEATKRNSELKGKMVDTAIMAAPFIAATKSAIDFETAMNGVAKQVQGARDDNLQLTPTYYAMQSNVMALSRELHMVPEKVADTTAAAARMGVQGADALNEFVRMSVQMGVAFEGSGDQIAEQMAKIANIRGIKLDTADGRAQIKDLADTVNYLDDQTTAKGPEIIEALQRISGTAAQSTFNNGELAALATTMIDLGKPPEIAATGLNALMNRIATAPSQAKPFQEALSSIGLSAKDLQASYMTDSKGTIFNLLEKVNGLGAAQKAEVLTGLFGAEYQDDISALAAGMDKLKGNFDLLDDSARKGSMEKEFQAKMKTTQFAIEGVKQAASETGISLTQAFLPSIQVISGVFQSGAHHILAFQQQFPQLSNGIVMVGVGLIGFRLAWLATSFAMGQYRAQATSIRLLLAGQNAQMVINKTTMLLSAGATRTMAAGQWALNAAMSANPIGLVIAGVAALVAIGYVVYQNFDTVRALCTTMWESPTAQILLFAMGPVGWLINAGIGLIANWDTVKAWFVTLWEDPSTAIDQFCNYIKSQFDGALNWLGEKWDWVKGIFSQPIKANVQASAAAGGEAQVYANAAGGIYNRGSFLTTFAEESAEAAIPLDGSARAVGLWQRAGEILGVGGNGGNNITVTFAPVINGGGPEVAQQVQRQQESFMEQLQDIMHQNARVSYG